MASIAWTPPWGWKIDPHGHMEKFYRDGSAISFMLRDGWNEMDVREPVEYVQGIEEGNHVEHVSFPGVDGTYTVNRHQFRQPLSREPIEVSYLCGHNFTWAGPSDGMELCPCCHGGMLDDELEEARATGRLRGKNVKPATMEDRWDLI